VRHFLAGKGVEIAAKIPDKILREQAADILAKNQT